MYCQHFIPNNKHVLFFIDTIIKVTLAWHTRCVILEWSGAGLSLTLHMVVSRAQTKRCKYQYNWSARVAVKNQRYRVSFLFVSLVSSFFLSFFCLWQSYCSPIEKSVFVFNITIYQAISQLIRMRVILYHGLIIYAQFVCSRWFFSHIRTVQSIIDIGLIFNALFIFDSAKVIPEPEIYQITTR